MGVGMTMCYKEKWLNNRNPTEKKKMSEDVNGGGGEGSVRQSRHQTTWCQPEKKLRIKKKIIYFSCA